MLSAGLLPTATGSVRASGLSSVVQQQPPVVGAEPGSDAGSASTSSSADPSIDPDAAFYFSNASDQTSTSAPAQPGDSTSKDDYPVPQSPQSALGGSTGIPTQLVPALVARRETALAVALAATSGEPTLGVARPMGATLPSGIGPDAGPTHGHSLALVMLQELSTTANALGKTAGDGNGLLAAAHRQAPGGPDSEEGLLAITPRPGPLERQESGPEIRIASTPPGPVRRISLMPLARLAEDPNGLVGTDGSIPPADQPSDAGSAELLAAADTAIGTALDQSSPAGDSSRAEPARDGSVVEALVFLIGCGVPLAWVLGHTFGRSDSRVAGNHRPSIQESPPR